MVSVNRLRELRELSGLSAEQVAERMGTSPQHLGRLEKGQRRLSQKWIDRAATAFGCEPAAVISELPDINGTQKMIPLVGFIGAGQMYYSSSKGRWVACGEVSPPPGDTQGLKAVRVEGDSLWPVYRDGDTLYFRPSEGIGTDCEGSDCIVQVAGGDAYIKRLEGRPGAYRLEGYNQPPMADVEIQWAAKILFVARK